MEHIDRPGKRRCDFDNGVGLQTATRQKKQRSIIPVCDFDSNLGRQTSAQLRARARLLFIARFNRESAMVSTIKGKLVEPLSMAGPLEQRSIIPVCDLDSNRGRQTSAQLRARARLLIIARSNRDKAMVSTIREKLVEPLSMAGPLDGSQIRPTFLEYRYLGSCNQVCEFCGARFWLAESLSGVPLSNRPRYNKCCRGGKVRIPFPMDPPESIKSLFEDSLFLADVRAYNSMFSMTSFGAKVDDSINHGSGPYVFKVAGQISHWLGSLCPSPNESPRFMQMYIYDTENEVANRLRFFGSGEENALSCEIVKKLIETLNEVNELVKLMRTARDLCVSTNVPEFSIRLYHGNRHPTYDTPLANSLGAIVCGDHPFARDFDVVIHHKEGTPQRVSKLHPSYMALQYPLLFPLAEQGWSPKLRMHVDPSSRRRHMTMNMFYSYQIHDRAGVYTLLLRAGRLFQQYLVDAYICIEQNRLEYINLNQNLFRTEFLHGIHDALSRGDTEGRSVGRRIILPSSFIGGPRYMYKHYQDALAICRVHGSPQYFITFTCNVKWPEIKNYGELREGQSESVQDRPDIIARVFQLKVECFIKFLKMEKPFGDVAAELYTIEFQNRGLPHCHTLLWVTPPHQICSPQELDRFISAEIPDSRVEPELYRIVTESMMHGPCGLTKPKSPCMLDGACSKLFPKNYEASTRFDKNRHVYYKRASTSDCFIKGGVPLDNGYVVPYNKTLCKVFDAHINVEYCGQSMLVEYLFKYISKGADRVHFALNRRSGDGSANSACVNEIKNFVDGRYICPHEAAWRILNFPIHHRNPAVKVLVVHLEGMQNITFKEAHQLQDIVNSPVTKTTFTEWLRNNELDASGRHLRYIDYLSKYWWDSYERRWIRRSTNRTPSIGRLIYIHPTCGELFYMRMLLEHQTGCTSFSDIRTVSGVVFPTYRGACERMGLLGDDIEWHNTFTEASANATPAELRSLFTHLLLFCDITNPLDLWKEHWHAMSNDVTLNIGNSHGVETSNVYDADLEQYVLYEVELLLNSSSSGSSLSTYDLPMPCGSLVASLEDQDRLLMEEKNYDKEKLASKHALMAQGLNLEQYNVYELVMNSCATDTQALLFLYAHGGTGKTYLWTTIIYALRSLGKIVLAVAASGIASLLLPSGRTAHSRFKIPIDLTNDSLCHIKKNTQLSQLLFEACLIIWDEAPMSDRRCFESLDKTLRDILDNPNVPFGGKSVLLGGDFRQTLPVKRKISKVDIIASSISRSYLWIHFKVIRLKENMRLSRSDISSNDRRLVARFSKWLLSVGDGKLGVPDKGNSSDVRNIEIPKEYLIENTDNALLALTRFIYDDNILREPNFENLSNRAIVCPKNETVDEINKLVLDMSTGESMTYLSKDSMVSHDGGDTNIIYPSEYLALLNFSGVPPHELHLKKKTPIMLLRNINQSAGLCNGTRLIVSQLFSNVIEAHIITGTAIGNRVYIPRINFIRRSKELPFALKRKQFPIKVCYAMTINKSQGQSFNKIGVYLPQPVFNHGQLYVAFSRAKSPDALKVLIKQEGDGPANTTKNIVFSDFLKEVHINEVPDMVAEDLHGLDPGLQVCLLK